MDKEREIVWEASALAALGKALKWIMRDSVVGAEKVKNGILKKLNQASKNPYRFPPDAYKIGNTGDYRSVVTHSYRISYRIPDTKIRVLRLRHVKRQPKLY